MVSSINLLVLSMYLIISNKFKRHPYPLIAITSAVESFYYCTLYLPNRICELNLARLFTYTKAAAKWDVEWSVSTSAKEEYRSLLFLKGVQLFIDDLSLYLNLFFNTVIFIDLLMTLRNPFYPGTMRILIFYLFAVLQVIAIAITFRVGDVQTKLRPGFDFKTEHVWYLFAENILAVVIFLVTLLVFIRLASKETPALFRKRVCKQHMLYFAFYLVFLLWTFKDYYDSQMVWKWGNNACYFHWVANSIGFFLACVRFSEPFVWSNFSADVKRVLFCRKFKANIAQQPLNSFLNSTMNVEYVYMLLVGINFHLDPVNKVVSSDLASKKLRIDQTHQMTKFTFRQIVNHHTKWNPVEVYNNSSVNSEHAEFNVISAEADEFKQDFSPESSVMTFRHDSSDIVVQRKSAPGVSDQDRLPKKDSV